MNDKSDSSDLASEHSDNSDANERILSESEDETGVPDITKKEFAVFRRFISPESDEEEGEAQRESESESEVSHLEGDKEASTEIAAALNALHKAFPLASLAIQDSPEGPFAHHEDDKALKAVLRLRACGTKAQKHTLELVDWKAVRAAALDSAYPDHPKVAAVMSKLRGALTQQVPGISSTDIFTHRASVVQTALRKAWELDTAIDLLAPHPKYKLEKLQRAEAAKPECASGQDATQPASRTAKKRKAKPQAEGLPRNQPKTTT